MMAMYAYNLPLYDSKPTNTFLLEPIQLESDPNPSITSVSCLSGLHAAKPAHNNIYRVTCIIRNLSKTCQSTRGAIYFVNCVNEWQKLRTMT